MKIALRIAVALSAVIILSVLFKIGYSEYKSFRRSEQISVAMLENTYVPHLHSTAPPAETTESTAKPEPITVSIPEEILIFTAENNPGSPVGSTTDNISFDKSVFVGDSVSLGFSRFCSKKSLLKDTVFLTAGSYAVHYALSDNVSEDKGFKHPMYKGKETPLKSAIAEIKPKNIYFCLGINDITGFGVEGTVKNYCKLINSVWAIDPDIHIYIVSTTFMKDDAQQKKLNNYNLASLNHNMKTICEKYYNLDYIDVMSHLQNGDFALSDIFCSDKFIHQNDAAYFIWASKLGLKRGG